MYRAQTQTDRQTCTHMYVCSNSYFTEGVVYLANMLQNCKSNLFDSWVFNETSVSTKTEFTWFRCQYFWQNYTQCLILVFYQCLSHSKEWQKNSFSLNQFYNCSISLIYLCWNCSVPLCKNVWTEIMLLLTSEISRYRHKISIHSIWPKVLSLYLYPINYEYSVLCM